METVFNVMADSVTDEVSYLDFCKSLSSFVKRDPIIMQSLVKFSVMEVRKILREEVLTVLDEAYFLKGRTLQEFLCEYS